jgi:eukaryotic-like serine/threonine-protein kinase
MIGRVVGTSYRIVEKIGEGGMGAVYRAVDQMLERDVALKAIRPELSREPEIIERFRAEARTLARIHHSAIANVYTFFYEGEELFLAMELVAGRPLSKVLSSEGPMPWERAVALLASAMDGIQVAHDAGIVHRDLKPENLMVSGDRESGTLKVMDFGIARVMGSGHLTRTGLLVGTLRYMSPEQIRGEEVDGRADVYALGAVLYEMLTGRPPFEGASDWAILRAQIEDTPRPPGEQIPLLPWWIDRAVLKALAKQPAERFQTVEEMRRTLVRQGETMPGRPQPAHTAPLDELPTVVTPPGSRMPTPRPVPPPAPPPVTVPAVTPPPVPPPLPPVAVSGPAASSYRPVEIPRRGSAAWKGIAAATLTVLLLGIAGLFFWLSDDGAPGVAQTGPAATEPASNPAAESPQESEPAAEVEEETLVAAQPVSAPAPRPAQQTAPPPLERQEEPARPAPDEEPAGETAATYTPPPPAEEPAVPEAAPMEEMRRLSGELQTESAQLIDTYQVFLDGKDEAEQEITDDDELLQEHIEELADAAERFRKQLEGGGFIGRLRRRSGDDIARLRQRGRELNQRGEQIEALMTRVQPNPEVQQAWQSIRRKWKRMEQIAAELR